MLHEPLGAQASTDHGHEHSLLLAGFRSKGGQSCLLQDKGSARKPKAQITVPCCYYLEQRPAMLP